MASIRLKGLVSRMQRVREQLVAGIPADQVDDFRTQIQRTLEQVEALCAARRSTPRQLAPPSYQAYRFLKTLDLKHLPLGDPGSQPSARPLRIPHLIPVRERTQAELATIARLALVTSTPPAAQETRLAALSRSIESTATDVEAIALQAHSHIARLTPPSRQAYAWLKFLSVPENLQLHLNALWCAYVSLKEIEGQKRYAGGPFRLALEFYHTESEWRICRRGDEIHATFSEGFIGADPAVMQALVRLAFHARRKSYLQIVRTYATGDEFAEILQAIELPTVELDLNVRGRFYNLNQVFERVNRGYFEGRLIPPRLTWNKTSTIRLMGHYQRATDTVMISLSLDHPEVPEWAIDHVMHHELLHRVLGSQVVNGRLYAHTPEFREAERTFRDYERADAFLNRWSTKLRRRH